MQLSRHIYPQISLWKTPSISVVLLSNLYICINTKIVYVDNFIPKN